MTLVHPGVSTVECRVSAVSLAYVVPLFSRSAHGFPPPLHATRARQRAAQITLRAKPHAEDLTELRKNATSDPLERLRLSLTLYESVHGGEVPEDFVVPDTWPEPLRGQIPLTSGAATLPVALALCEVVGPARLALTVAATPAVAGALRSNARFVELEDSVNERLLELLPGGGSD